MRFRPQKIVLFSKLNSTFHTGICIYQTKSFELNIASRNKVLKNANVFVKIQCVHPYEVRPSFVTKRALGEFRREDSVGEPGRAASPAL